MKRSLSFFIAVPAIVVACASNDELDFGSVPSNEPDASSPTTGGSYVDPSADSGTPDTANPTPDATASSCGDGKITEGEECDDGNTSSNDGCSADCKLESAGPNDICPGSPITISAADASSQKVTITGSTAGLYSQYGGSCGGASGKEAVYQINADFTGILEATLTSDFDSTLYARRTCDDEQTESGCNDAPGAKGGEVLRIPMTQGQPAFLFVDGYSGAAGNFTLDLAMTTAYCGNGVAEAPEVCDDGNTVSGDGCAADCTLEAGGVASTCPGRGITLSGTGDSPRSISILGTTTGTTTSTPLVCRGAGANDIYSITPDVDGSMTATLTASYNQATLHARTECATASTQLDCLEATAALQTIQTTFPVRAGMPAYVIADSTTSIFAGTYSLDVTVTPARCGNKLLDPNEQCDDGNNDAGDGCDASCRLEPLPAGIDTCPGAPLDFAKVDDSTYKTSLTASTSSLTSDYKPKAALGTCQSTQVTYSAKDAVFMIDPPITGFLRAKVKGNFNTQLYARTGCDADAAAFTDLACSDAIGGTGAESIAVPVTKGTRLYLIVDGSADLGSGAFQLDVSITASVCGNGIIEGGETCDDGNSLAGDGCGPSCLLEPVTRDNCSLYEMIDMGTPSGGVYSKSIYGGTTGLTNDQSFIGCGSGGADAFYKFVSPIDGVLNVEVPTSSLDVSIGARNSCPVSAAATVALATSCATTSNGGESFTLAVAKDQTYWIIVDGVNSNTFGSYTMNVKLMPPGCGDGLVSGNEPCDDGNNVDGDGCSATCTVETLANVNTCPGYALTLQGSGSGPRTGVVTIDTSKLTGEYAGSCGGSSKDAVVVVTPPISGKLTAKLTGINYQPIMYIRTSCTDAATEAGCDSDLPTPGTDSRDLTVASVTAGTPYYIFIDGYNGSAGIGRLNVMVTP